MFSTRKVYVTTSPGSTPSPPSSRSPVFSRKMAGPCSSGTAAGSSSVTLGPVGGVPTAVARFSTTPASMSAWSTAYVASHPVDAPGASVVSSQVTSDRPTNGSVTSTFVRVTFPVLVTVNVYVITSPGVAMSSDPSSKTPDLSRSMPGVWVSGTSSSSVSSTSGPDGGVPSAVAELRTSPASMSSWVML